jgi:hypothetical protein
VNVRKEPERKIPANASEKVNLKLYLREYLIEIWLKIIKTPPLSP